MQLHHHHPMEPNPAHQLYSLFTRISIFCITILILSGYSAGKQCRNCGSAVVPYPLSTSTGCGDPNYPVFCNTTTGVLYLRSINGSTYPITSIDPQSQRFIIQPARFVGNSCRTSDIIHNGAHLDESWPFNFTTENTVFLLNCSSNMLQTPIDCASSSLCWRYLRQTPDEAVSCRNSSICCTIVVGGSLFSYGILVKDTRCTAYKSFVNLNTKLPIRQWPEGLQVQWRLPPELECRNQTDCLRAVSNSTCRKDPTANGTILRCFCNSNHRWDPVTGACIDIPRGCLSSWSCHKGKYIALISGLTSAVSLLLMFGLLIYRKHRLAMEAHSRLTKEWEEILSANSGGRSSKLFSGRDMKNATNNFSKDRLLGAGGFGEVYMGFLQDGTVIAVKIAKVHNTKGTMQVLNEVSILSQVNHRSLVRLLGCCVELERPAMVYEFIPNGTLYDHIYTGRYSFLNWHQRLRIAHQTAEGLAYLHSSAVPPIYHRDVKSSNILLDEKCNAKVSDFGLSRIIVPEQTHVSTCAQGTIGYLDPEYYRNYQLTDKSDVYSFGVVLLELLTSKRVIDYDRDENDVNLVAYVQHWVDEGRTMEAVDENLKLGASQGSLETMKALCSLALTCLEERRQNRPSMKEVVEHIEYIIGTEQTASIFLSRHA